MHTLDESEKTKLYEAMAVIDRAMYDICETDHDCNTEGGVAIGCGSCLHAAELHHELHGIYTFIQDFYGIPKENRA